jgi:hypothetical protein
VAEALTKRNGGRLFCAQERKEAFCFTQMAIFHCCDSSLDENEFKLARAGSFFRPFFRNVELEFGATDSRTFLSRFPTVSENKSSNSLKRRFVRKMEQKKNQKNDIPSLVSNSNPNFGTIFHFRCPAQAVKCFLLLFFFFVVFTEKES